MNFYSHRTLEGRTEKLMNQLLAIGIGDRPIIFLAHSMGGLLVKNILVSGKLSFNKHKLNTILEPIYYLVFMKLYL